MDVVSVAYGDASCVLPLDAAIGEAGGLSVCAREDIAQIDQRVAFHARPCGRKVARAELVPFGEDRDAIGTLAGIHGALAPCDGRHQRLGLPAALRVVHAQGGAVSMGTMARLGASRISSVLGLNVTLRMAIVLPRALPPNVCSMRHVMAILRSWSTRSTCSMMDRGARCSRPVRISAETSSGRQEPP